MPDGTQFNTARIAVTYFADQYAKDKHQLYCSFDELAQNIRMKTWPDKASMHWLKLAVFGDRPSERNCLRHNANVISVSGAEGDYDGGAITFDEVVARVRAAKVKALIYSTPSSTDAKPHWRILCPFSTPLEPAQRAELVDRVNGLIGGGLAPESWVLSTAYYFGSVEGQPPVRVEIIDGDYVNLRPDIASVPNPNATKKKAETEGVQGTADGAPEGDPMDLAMYVEQIGNDERPWEEWNSILMALFAASGGSDLGQQLAVEWSAKAAKHVAGEVEKRWKHYRTSPPTRIGAGMLRRMARDETWVARATEWANRQTTGEGEPFGAAAAEDTGAFLMTETDIFAMPDPVVLVRGMLMERENVCLVGPPKSGKSYLALDIALSIAAGLPVLNTLQTYRQGAVVYLTGEGAAGFKRRVKAWRQARKIPADRKLPFYFKASVPMTAQGAAEAKRYVDGIRNSQIGDVVIVVVDTMARSLGIMDENAAASAAAYLNLTEEIRNELDTTLLTLAHASDKPTAALQIRGSSGFGAGFDSVWTLRMDKANHTAKMTALYMKEADESDGYGPWCFRMESEFVEGMANGRGAVLKMVSLREWQGSGETSDDDQRVAYLRSALEPVWNHKFTRTTLAQYLVEWDLRGFDGEPVKFDERNEDHRIQKAKQEIFLKNGLRLRKRAGGEPLPGVLAEFTTERHNTGRIEHVWQQPKKYWPQQGDDDFVA